MRLVDLFMGVLVALFGAVTALAWTLRRVAVSLRRVAEALEVPALEISGPPDVQVDGDLVRRLVAEQEGRA